MTGNDTVETIARSHAYLTLSAFAGKYRIACLVKNSPLTLPKGTRPAPLPPETVKAAFEDYRKAVALFHPKGPDENKT